MNEQIVENSETLIFHYSPDALALHEMIYDDEGKPVDYRFLTVNPAFEKQTGLCASELLGKTVKQVLPATEQYWIDTYAEVVRNKSGFETRNYSSELGKHFRVYAYYVGGERFAVSIRDVSIEYEHMTVLREERDMVAALLELSPVAICLFDRQGRILRKNGHAEKIIEKASSALLGRSGDNSIRDGLLWRILASGKPELGCEILVPDPTEGGTALYLRVSAIPMPGTEGELTSVLMTMEDHSIYKQYELSLEQNLKDKTALIHEMNHRVKNNLAVIMGIIGLYRLKANGELVPVLQGLEDRIHSVSLLHGMLYNTSNTSVPKTSAFFSTLFAFMKQTMGSDAYSLELRIMSDLPPLPERCLSTLGIVMNELVSNAIKHAFPQITPGQSIELSLWNENNVLHLHVKDNGSGMDTKSFGTLCESGDSIRKGLFLVNILLKAVKGSLHAESSKLGTLISVIMPISKL